MSKKPKGVKKNKYIDTSKTITELNSIITQNLYLFSLLYCNDIYKIYENLEVTMPECLSSRDMDIYLPLFCIAKFIDTNSSVNNNIESILYEYSEDMSKIRNEQDIEDNLSYKLITDLYYMITEHKIKAYKDIYFLNTDIYSYLSYEDDYYFKSITALTKALSTLQIKHTRINTNIGKKTYYIITSKHLENLIANYNIVLPEIIDAKDIEEIDNDNIFNN